jgi:hypothetical protein
VYFTEYHTAISYGWKYWRGSLSPQDGELARWTFCGLEQRHSGYLSFCASATEKLPGTFGSDVLHIARSAFMQEYPLLSAVALMFITIVIVTR